MVVVVVALNTNVQFRASKKEVQEQNSIQNYNSYNSDDSNNNNKVSAQEDARTQQFV